MTLKSLVQHYIIWRKCLVLCQGSYIPTELPIQKFMNQTSFMSDMEH